MNKEKDNIYYSIGEVSKIVKLKEHVIRFWEKEFDVLDPIINSNKNNRRKYTDEDIQIIQRIKTLLYKDGLTIKGAQKHLQKDNQELTNQNKTKTLHYPKQTITPLEKETILSNLKEVVKLLS